MFELDEYKDLARSDEQEGTLDDAEESGVDDIQTIRYDISSYGADFLVDGLISRLKTGDVYIPKFQREFVWSLREASRFIESLLLGLPVPGIFLSKDSENKLLVVDGQQRLTSLLAFYSNEFKKHPFRLQDVDPAFANRRYLDLEPADRRNLDNAVIHATIVQQNEPSNDSSGIYSIFERLNNGGRRLYPQEIRASIYGGSLNTLINSLNDYPSWRRAYGEESARLKDVEMILRYLALRNEADSYEKPMKGFLNRFMERNRNIDDAASRLFAADFKQAIDAVIDAVGQRAFRPTKAFNAAVFDSVTVGISRAIANSELSSEAILFCYDGLLASEEYRRVTSRATSDEQSVRDRLRLATEAFATK